MLDNTVLERDDLLCGISEFFIRVIDGYTGEVLIDNGILEPTIKKESPDMSLFEYVIDQERIGNYFYFVMDEDNGRAYINRYSDEKVQLSES